MPDLSVVPVVVPPVAPSFDQFWELYPRRVAKKDARAAWVKIPGKLHPEILVSLAGWRKEWLKRGEMEFVPHAATWLNGERWTDELPQQAQTPTIAAHRPATLVPDTRGEMPEAVRAQLAQFRSKP